MGKTHRENLTNKKRFKAAIAYALLMLGVIWQLNVHFGPASKKPGWSAQSLETAIQAEIPARASRARVEAWLKARKIEHSYSLKTYDDLERVVSASVEKTTQQFLLTGLTVIYFFFDPNDRMIRYEIKEIFSSI